MGRRKRKGGISRIEEQETEMPCPLCEAMVSDEDALIDHVGDGQCPSQRHTTSGYMEPSDPTLHRTGKKGSRVLRSRQAYNKFSHRKEPYPNDSICVTPGKSVGIGSLSDISTDIFTILDITLLP